MESDERKQGLSSVERLLDELDEIQHLRQRRHCADRPLKLERYQIEVIRLHLAGASLADICLWLARRRIHVARSTVRRAILRWAEQAARQRAAIEAVQLDLLSQLQATDDDA